MPNPQQEQEHTLKLAACASHVSDYIGVAIQALFYTLSTGEHTSIAETIRLENGFIQLQPMPCSNCSNQQTTPLNRYILNTLKSIEAMAEREHPDELHYANTLRNIFIDLVETHKATDGLYHMLTCLINYYIKVIEQAGPHKVSSLPETNTGFTPITHALFFAKFHTACSPAPKTETLTEPLDKLLQALSTRKPFAYPPINSNANVHYVPHQSDVSDTPPSTEGDNVETDNKSTIGTPDEPHHLPTESFGTETCNALRLRLFGSHDSTLFAKTFRTTEKKARQEAELFDAYRGINTHSHAPGTGEADDAQPAVVDDFPESIGTAEKHPETSDSLLFRLSEVDTTGVATFLLLMEGYGDCITWRELCTKAYTLTQDQVLTLATNLVKEMKQLGEKHIAHGDLHRGNVLINRYTNDVHLVDFGLATRFTEKRKIPVTVMEKNNQKIDVRQKWVLQYLLDGWKKVPSNPYIQMAPWTYRNPIRVGEAEHNEPYAIDSTLNIYPCKTLLSQLFLKHAPIFYLASEYAGILNLHKPEEMNMALLDDWLAVFKDPEAYLAQSNTSPIHRRTARFYRLFKKLTNENEPTENEPTFTQEEIGCIQKHNSILREDFHQNPCALARIQFILDAYGPSRPLPP
ncbi:MAG: hypothetical protein COV52_00940 [Gammaproteobacteria bacterium CG11_big_fil_rev_8_21_14_0_20_46_22]|nr:MAG: hypothetical protein COW05_03040 [Gammaproteobacteria bacterium CG12_big_fil_rev_8_21_14_0_65_46_12]PIR11983.1 MAG: hypothetical protein COV52_00940 [Gammaproteobacteria bacterium CG11_big_fil_rev_8_21_14_0_20_46_22]